MKLSVVVLAAGQGTRMRSSRPKVLHDFAGQPMLSYIINAAKLLNPDNLFVIFSQATRELCEFFPEPDLQWIEQAELLGTGHAVLQALPKIPDDHQVLVLVGDMPMISPETLQRLLKNLDNNTIGVVTAINNNPAGLGRIIRDENNQAVAIIEEKDASETQKNINEINSGIISAPATYLKQWLPNLRNNNSQKEYYLTDIISLAAQASLTIETVTVNYPEEVQGINTQWQLTQLERFYYLQKTKNLMEATGVKIMDPQRFDLRGELTCGQEVEIDINVIIQGHVKLGDRVKIGANCILNNVEIADDAVIKPNCMLEETKIGAHSQIGPFARLRPETELADHVHIGNFVETKKTVIGSGSKANHLTYLGNSTIGSGVNVGAGTITCNYDGANKHPTSIGDNAFIGSGTQLVAPVKVGVGATIGAGSVITKNAPDDSLSLTRVSQRCINGWQRPKKQKRD